MDIKEMNFDELEQRKAEIREELKSADKEGLERISLELDSIEERKAELKAEAEERAKVVEEVINAPNPTPIIEERKEKMTSKEIRSTNEYIDAYVEYCKRNYDLDRLDAEKRALLTENAGEGGTIAVPVYIEDRINTNWENDEIMRRVRRTFFPGNVKVGVEVSSDGAQIHEEGDDPITEENLVINYIDLIPEYIKKMVKVSHTAMALRGTAFLDYLYDEVEYQLVKKAASETVKAIVASTLTATVTGGLTAAKLIEAEGNLGGEATDVVLITTRANAAALKSAVISSGNFPYDPFDGMTVLYTDAASLGTALGIVADLSGIQANFPEGDQPRFIFDEFTEAPANIVRIVGRLLMAVDVVATGKTVKITA